MKELDITEKKHRDHTKTGKLAKRRETRRLEAIERQVRRVMTFEKALEKAKKKGEAQAKLTRAQLTLQKIRGGQNQQTLEKYASVVEPANPGKAVK